MKKIKFSVVRLQIHLKNQQRILFDFIDAVTTSQSQNNEKFRQIILTEYFKMNRRVQDVENVDLSSSYEHLNLNKNFKQYTYSDISKHFVWKTKKEDLKSSKKIKCVRRMFFMNFKLSEIFYLRLLLNHVKKVTSFENLRIVDVQIENVVDEVIERQFMKNFKNVCIHLEFIDNDDKWHVVMKKITEFDTIAMFRKLIMIILLKCVSDKSSKL